MEMVSESHYTDCLEYFYVSKIDQWEIVWKKFIESPNSSVLEVITDSSTNDKMWNSRFK